MSATPELACLKGARAVMTTEVDEGSFLSEALIKQMTGGDPISARHLYGVPFEFRPLFKLFMAGNHKPGIRGGDEGIWRRIDMIPFTVTIAQGKRDRQLGEKLRAELPGILNWAIKGCLEWQDKGLASPPAVTKAVAEYKGDTDILGQWLETNCETGDDKVLWSSVAYSDYTGWATYNGLRPWSHVVFGRKLKERFPSKREAMGVLYSGLCLKGGDPSVGTLPKNKVTPNV